MAGIASTAMLPISAPSAPSIIPIVLYLFQSILVMVLVIASTTRRSVDGMVVIAFPAMLAISAPIVPSIIPIVLYLIPRADW